MILFNADFKKKYPLCVRRIKMLEADIDSANAVIKRILADPVTCESSLLDLLLEDYNLKSRSWR